MRNEVAFRVMYIVVFLANIQFGFASNITIGSDSAPSRPARPSFSGSGNVILGFAALDSGFSLADASTSCLYNDFYPICSQITFNGGTLQLAKNLVLGSNATFTNGGIIGANSYQLDMPDVATVFAMPAGMTMGNVKLKLHSNMVLSGTLTFTGVSSIDGRGYTIDCASGCISVATNSSLSLQDVTLKNVSGGSFSCIDNTVTVTCNNVAWILSGDYSFNQGKFAVIGDWALSGGKVFTYASNQPTTIYTNATMLFDQGMTFSYAPSNSSKSLLVFNDCTATLHLYQTAWYVKDTGIQLTKGTIVFEGMCPIASQATSSTNGVRLGDGTLASNNITIKGLAESGPYVLSGFLVNDNV